MRPRGWTKNHKRRRAPRPRRVVVTTLTAVVAGAGTAAAIWTSHGESSGAAGTTTPRPVTVVAGTPVAGLHPGGSADLALTISNPNTAEVVVPALVLDPAGGDSGFAVDPAHAGCAPASFGFRPPSGGWVVPGRSGGTDGTLTFDVENAVTMSADAPDACQGAVATVFVKAAP